MAITGMSGKDNEKLIEEVSKKYGGPNSREKSPIEPIPTTTQ